MAKNAETGKFIPDATGDNQGKFVDDTLNTVVIAGTYFKDAAIIPTIQYQVFGLDRAWSWDDEGQNYTFTTVSTIKIQVINGTRETYYEVVDNSGLELQEITNPTAEQIAAAKGEITDITTVPDGAEENDIYYTVTEILTPTPAEETPAYEYNKYGKETPNSVILVDITPNSDLASNYPGAIVTVNGKEHDLAYLNTPIRLYMDRNYTISINWVWGEKVETFRIICD